MFSRIVAQNWTVDQPINQQDPVGSNTPLSMGTQITLLKISPTRGRNLSFYQGPHADTDDILYLHAILVRETQFSWVPGIMGMLV